MSSRIDPIGHSIPENLVSNCALGAIVNLHNYCAEGTAAVFNAEQSALAGKFHLFVAVQFHADITQAELDVCCWHGNLRASSSSRLHSFTKPFHGCM
ncbi:MAG: hypothetical protein K2W95_25115 [Candidatus Obscuribacterales bacterium]|nr:hypothetical protein [Candidatus Obscuribacterales bacterium]